MIRSTTNPPNSTHHRGDAMVLLNGKLVGVVHASGSDTSWGFGEFKPMDDFASFAPLFGVWSLFMHSQDEQGRLSKDAAIELARAEVELAKLRAELVFLDDKCRVKVAAITIDGNLLEWKEI